MDFGKGLDSTVATLYWAPKYDIMMVDTINKSYKNTNKGGLQKTIFSPSSSYHQTDSQNVSKPGSQTAKVIEQPKVNPNPYFSSFPKYNILKQMDNVKEDASLLDVVIVLEQKKHPKTFTISSLIENEYEEELHVNKLVVHKPRNPVKNPPFYVSMKIMDKLAHYCVIDGGSGPNAMSRIIMEELGLHALMRALKVC